MSTPRTPRPHLRRERLTAVLDRGDPITVLRAPMGFGKTAVVADWVSTLPAERRDSTVWITADPEWDDPNLFWVELQAALATIGVEIRDADHPGPASVRTSLAAHDEPVIVVVDAVDRLVASHVPAGLIELVRRAPLVQLVVCTRARIFERSTWLELDGAVMSADDLALTESESRELLAHFDIDLSAEDVDTIVNDVLGWPLALRATALALTDGAHRDVDLALAEAHRQLRESVLTFIEDSKLGPSAFPASLLAEFTGRELEDSVEVGFGARTGEELAAAGLVVAEAGDPVRYRWPPIIGRIVADEFSAVEPERVRALHVRLADHYIAADVPLPAMMHSARAQDWARVEVAIGRTIGRLITFHREQLRDVFAEIPEHVIANSVVLSATREYLFAIDDGPAILTEWNLPESSEELRALVRNDESRVALNQAGMVTLVMRRRGQWDRCLSITERISRLAVMLRTEHHDEGIACAIHLAAGINYMHLYERDSAATSFRMAFRDGNRPDVAFEHVPRDAASKLALLLAATGEMGRSEAWLERSEDMPLAYPSFRAFIEGNRAAARVLIAVERGDVAGAVPALAALLGTPSYEDFWLLHIHAHARIALLRGDPIAALRELTSAEARERRAVAHPWIASMLLADEIDLNLALGNGTRARAVLDAAVTTEAATLVARARLALVAGQVEAALEDARATPLADHTSVYWELQAKLIEAVALHRLARTAEAAEVLGSAVARARTEQAYGAFATVPRADLRAMLAAAQTLDVEAELERLPEMFPSALTSISLTGRERVILGYLAAGLTLNAIARRETVSINTVKSQYRTLYRKLGATRREDALRIARSTGLID